MKAAGLFFLAGIVGASAQPFVVNSAAPVIERWMYAFNAAPCDRPAGSVFGTFGDDSGVDTRHGQHLLGWDTDSLISTNLGPTRYLVRRCRVILTINRGNLFAYDPTHDSFRTYFETNHPAREADSDAGRPVELFAASFRNGFDAASFDQCALFGSNAAGERNAFVAAYSTNGTLIDIGNNVGKTNEAFPRFEVVPFAIGQTASTVPGQLVPAGAKITFDLNLADPLVLAYVQNALDTGRLRLMVSSLHVNDGQTGTPRYPDFAARFNEAVFDPTRLELEGIAVRDSDSDADGLPDDWENFYFTNLTANASDDLDGDMAGNLTEYHAGTDPLQAASVLRFLSITREASGSIILRFTHAASRQYTIEFTEDFQNWTPLATAPVFEVGVGTIAWIDPASPASQRFYRLRAETP